jgi:phosphate transport system protein
MTKKHIVKSFDAELSLLKSMLSEMGKECEDQLAAAFEALRNRDNALAEKTIASDARINDMQNEIDQLSVRMLATRQPMALDLRNIISGLKIAAELERIADYAANIAKHVSDLNHVSLEKPVEAIIKMAEIAKQMLNEIMNSYLESNIQRAIEVWHRDKAINDIYSNLLIALREHMTEDSKNIKSYTSLVFVARCCERIGDHITNIAESVHYIELGKPYLGNDH